MYYKKRQKLIKSEVVNLFKTTKETLRHYESVGLISPEIDEKKYRYYDIREMKRLRQIFLYRDLGFSIEQMKMIIDNGMENKEYKQMLSMQNEKLVDKIARLQETQYHISQLLDLLEDGSDKISFKVRHFSKRFYYVFNPFDSPFLESMKGYYDQFKTLIESPYYSERSLISIFPFSVMDEMKKEDSRMCIEMDKNLSHDGKDSLDFDSMILPEGHYLSVFYIFNEGKFNELGSVKQEIEAYISINNFAGIDDTIIEIEHPELSNSLEAGKTVYEIQLRVEKI